MPARPSSGRATDGSGAPLQRGRRRADTEIMEALLIAGDPLVRDLVKVGLRQFPDVEVTVGAGHAGVSLARSKRFDCVLLAVDPREPGTMQHLEHLRSFERDADLFVLTEPRNVKDMAVDKTKYNVHSFLAAPVAVRDFFGAIGRYLERRAEGRRAAATARA